MGCCRRCPQSCDCQWHRRGCSRNEKCNAQHSGLQTYGALRSLRQLPGAANGSESERSPAADAGFLDMLSQSTSRFPT